jgi:tetratricopeptide (TPR) repeat protein
LHGFVTKPLPRADHGPVDGIPGYGGHVAELSREQFDSLEFDAAASGDHAAAALAMMELASESEAAAVQRADAFLRAGDQWLLADKPAKAVTAFRRAVAYGGPRFADPLVPLARALFQLGRQAEAQALINRLKAEGPRDPRTCDLAAELLVEQGELPAALDLATAGVRLCLAARESGQTAGEEPELRLLLRLRYRIRNDLGLPEDEYDSMLDEP